VSKSVALEVEIGGTTYRMGAIAKGSGMIHPNMATMLGVLTCDAPVTPEVWTGIVKRGSMNSFNQVRILHKGMGLGGRENGKRGVGTGSLWVRENAMRC
jgi:N-acetylglutamate synthase/N-acetylornithine aminotransferase